jgi:hypothetical protein
MYFITSATGVKKGIHKQWQAIDLTSLSVASLYTTYRKVWLTLTLSTDPTPLYLDMDDVATRYATYAGTFAEWLVFIAAQSLPTRTTGPIFRHRSAKFCDAFKAGYTVTPVTHANVDSASTPMADKPDVRLTRTSPVTDYTAFFTHCLVSINGFYHLSDTDGVNGIVVSDAMTTLRHSRQNQIGLLSFSTVCSLQIVPITASMLQHTEPGQANVTLPQDLTNKTVMLVLGGYLHVIDPVTFQRIAQDTFKVDFLSLPLLERYYESKKYLDLSSLNLESSPTNDQQIGIDDLLTPEVLTAYLTLSQSFLVILDCPEIYLQKQFIKRTGLPDMYIAYNEPIYPLVTALGRHPEYWYTLEDGQYSVTVYDALVENRIFDTVMTAELASVDAGRRPAYPGSISPAHFLEIGRDI